MNFEIALEIAKQAHSGQYDKAGKPYIEHILTVAQNCETENEKVVALLHDTLEDTQLTLDDLISKGLTELQAEALVLLTKKREDDYFEYIKRIKNNATARKVKIADLTHNMDINRLEIITQKDEERIKKYKKAYSILIE